MAGTPAGVNDRLTPTLQIEQANGGTGSSHIQSKLTEKVCGLVVGDRCAFEEPGINHLHTAQVCFTQVGTFKARRFHMCIAEASAFKNRLPKITSGKVSL